MDKNDIYTECTYKDGLVYKNCFHAVFCTKYRRKVLIEGVDVRLREVLHQIALQNNIKIQSLAIKPDHVHMIIEFDPRLTLHKVVKDFKRNSAQILREEFPHLKKKIPSLWTRSYFSCSTGQITDDAITHYITSQKNK